MKKKETSQRLDILNGGDFFARYQHNRMYRRISMGMLALFGAFVIVASYKMPSDMGT